MKRRHSRKRNPKLLNTTKLSICAALVTITVSGISTESSALSMGGFVTYVKEQLLQQQSNDAFKTLAAQEYANGGAVAENKVKLAQTDISAELRLKQKEEIIDNYNNFLGSSSRTGFSGCEAMTTRLNDGLVEKKNDLMINSDMFMAANSGTYASEYDRNNSLLQLKYSSFCTLDMAKQGICTTTVSDALYYDNDLAAGLSTNRISESQLAGGKTAAMTIASTVRDSATTQICSKSDNNCLSSLAQDNERVAVNSMVSYSLLNQLYNRMAVNGTTTGN